MFGVTDPDSQEIIRLQSHSGGQGVYFWNAGVPWGPLRTPVGCDKIQWKTAIAQVHAGLLLDQILQKEKRFRSPSQARNLDQPRCLPRAEYGMARG